MARNLLRVLLPALAAGAIVAGGGTAALADGPTEGSVVLDAPGGGVTTLEVKNVGGGQWHYGTSLTEGFSNYYHERNCHGSSAVSGRNYVQDYDVPRLQWSRAGVWRDGKATIEAYWRNTC
ncbi:hypothetical protein DP939_42065 [Spongiactinospora rosea]|uniref:Lactococcin 972 family bacteriocin n=1 Tax=Spongiactinospora rosea TaxID=2248750 RepID=A0A366LJT3_9ACTN|nr:lactococcin 972 family bacteriocin [Spongiactinospora rosea]RBQ14148.1 hypothetical protein DP939_42065 [Spongiactinospora rosea]